jgi:hypothetical protein
MGLLPQATIGRTPQQRLEAMRFICRCCNARERGPRALLKLMPDAIYALHEGERARRTKLSADLAVLDGERFFIRSVVKLPIRRVRPDFEFGCWAEVNRADFRMYLAEYDNRKPAFGPFACSLDSDLQPYSSRGLPAFLHMQPDKHRPVMSLVDGDSRLARDQAAGIDLRRLAHVYRAWGHDTRI